MSVPSTGHDGPFPAVHVTPTTTVPADWIDYNGHMNVAYYTMAIDQAIDHLLETALGVGESFVAETRMGPYALQSHIAYLGELLEGDAFFTEILLIDSDPKRLHLMILLKGASDGALSATCEQLLMNVDLTTRRSAAYPDWAQARMQAMTSAHAETPRPDQLGQPLGIRRKG
ncbi:MAG: thioesterase family protein [Pseudomonadota bacterium]